MRWSLKLGRVAGIVVQVHFTFFLLIAWIFYERIQDGEGVAAAARGVGLILAVFGCVVLHEFGHALAARRYGIVTRDITLLPIGGVARLERMPERPFEELVVALAGPAVNIGIAGVLAAVIAALGRLASVLETESFETDLLIQLLGVNLFLAVFNLIPAFPMDGGRVLRAFLAMRFDYRRATRVAAAVGQGFALLFAIAGFFGNPMLILIAVFVYLGAQGEARMVGARELVRGRTVRDAMLTQFRALPGEATLADAVAELLAGSQQDFPVVDGERFLGMLERNDLVKAIHEGRQGEPVRGVLRPVVPTLSAEMSLEQGIQRMRELGRSALPVTDGDRLVGLFTIENVGELLMLGEAYRAQRRSPPGV